MCNIINSLFEQGVYPDVWKQEFITPIPKVNSPETLTQFRPVSVSYNCAKLVDRILSAYIIEDMAPKRDVRQYGN